MFYNLNNARSRIWVQWISEMWIVLTILQLVQSTWIAFYESAWTFYYFITNRESTPENWIELVNKKVHWITTVINWKFVFCVRACVCVCERHIILSRLYLDYRGVFTLFDLHTHILDRPNQKIQMTFSANQKSKSKFVKNVVSHIQSRELL